MDYMKYFEIQDSGIRCHTEGRNPYSLGDTVQYLTRKLLQEIFLHLIKYSIGCITVVECFRNRRDKIWAFSLD